MSGEAVKTPANCRRPLREKNSSLFPPHSPGGYAAHLSARQTKPSATQATLYFVLFYYFATHCGGEISEKPSL